MNAKASLSLGTPSPNHGKVFAHHESEINQDAHSLHLTEPTSLPYTLTLQADLISSSTDSTPKYRLSNTLTLGASTIVLYRLTSSDHAGQGTPIFSLTQQLLQDASIARGLNSGPDFVLQPATPYLVAKHRFQQAVLETHVNGLLSKHKDWHLDRFVPIEEQEARKDSNVQLHKHENVLKGVANKKAGGFEWEFGKGSVVAISSGTEASLKIFQAIEEKLDLVVAAWVATLWKSLLVDEKKPIGMGDLKASLLRAPNTFGKGLGVNDIGYVPATFNDSTKS